MNTENNKKLFIESINWFNSFEIKNVLYSNKPWMIVTWGILYIFFKAFFHA